MKKIILPVLLFLAPACVFPQFRDDFSDKKLTGRTVNWTGNTDHFIVNSDLQLQLNAPKESGKSVLSTSSLLSGNAMWECWVKLGFSPSSSNYAKIYLANNSEELDEKTGCLFVRIGHTNKNVCLIMNDGKSEKIMITGSKDRLNKTSISLKIKVLLSKKGRLELYSRLEDEKDYILEGSALLEKDAGSSHFGLLCQYTSTRSTLFYFDDINVREMTEDENRLIDEKYGDNQQGENPEPLDIILNEIMFNAPSGCEEYVELYNRSDKPIELKYLSIATRKTDGTLNKAYPISSESRIIDPDDYVVVSKDIAVVCSYFSCKHPDGMVEMKSIPVLNNTGADLVLLNNWNEKIIDELIYSEKMHDPAIKDKKGVALERINPDLETNNADNWTSATASSGFGTPGYINSQYNKKPGVNTGDEIRVMYPEFHLGNNNAYEIRYHFDRPGNRCRILLFDMMGRMVNQIANNELLSMEGSLFFYGRSGSGKTLQAGVYIVYAEIYADNGKSKTYKIPVRIR